MSNDTSKANSQTVSVGDWIATMVIFCIPMVNVIVFIVWLASSGTPESKKNYLIALLIWWTLGVVLILGFWSAIAAFLTAYI